MSALAEILKDNPALAPRVLVGARVRVLCALPGLPAHPPILADVFSVLRTYMERRGPDRTSEIEDQRRFMVQAVGVPALWSASAHDIELLACRSCGCDHLHACQGPSGPCAWSKTDPTLCTACEGKKAPSTVREIVKAYLEEHGYHGLCEEDAHCACCLDDLFPHYECGIGTCEPGYLVPCTCGDHAFHITTTKPEHLRKEV